MRLRAKQLRWVEMLALFVGGPLILLSFPSAIANGKLFPFLWLMASLAELGRYLQRDRGMWPLAGRSAVPKAIGWVILRWLLASSVLVGLFGLLAGQRLPGLPIALPTGLFGIFRIEHPTMKWLPLLILFFYPWVSVYPQNILYRAFFVQRYRAILGQGWPLILFNATAFSFGHIVFNNWIVLLLTFIGGIIFTHTYLRTQSLLLAVIEHTMYGVFCFYVGVGVFLLYGGAG